MGTRNLTLVKHDHKYKVAQYCQSDGYPEGQGVRALDFIRNVERTTLEDALDRCVFIDEETLKRRWAECGAGDSDWVSMEVADRMKAMHPQLSRDMGAAVLDHIVSSKETVELTDSSSFAQDGLFCEWAYLIDLDTGTFEAFKGFNQRPLDVNERFYGEAGDNGYTPVKLVGRWDMDSLPDDASFVSHLTPSEGDDE